jgi:hypothetical protein
MQQIADWLKRLGRSEYTERFVENRIDLSVLPDLTDQDLENGGFCSGIAAAIRGTMRARGGRAGQASSPFILYSR